MNVIAERIETRARRCTGSGCEADPAAALARSRRDIRALVVDLHHPRIDGAYHGASSRGSRSSRASASATITSTPPGPRAHGIVVAHTPGVLDAETADTAIGLALNAVRRFPRPSAICARARWAKRAVPAHRLAARPHDGRARPRPHRQGDRQARRALSASRSSITAASRRTTRPISIIPR